MPVFAIFNEAAALWLVVTEDGIDWQSCSCAATQFETRDEAVEVCAENEICDCWIVEV